MTEPSRSTADPRRLERWLAAAHARRSCRTYAPDALTGPDAEDLESVCGARPAFDGARAVLLREAPPEVFTGWFLGVYGKVTSPAALVFIGDRSRKGAAARVGHIGEGAVLEATSLGLATCWIGGGVRRRVVAEIVPLGRRERVYAIAALGRAAGDRTVTDRAVETMVRARKRQPLGQITRGLETGAWPAWALAGLEVARVAPSARNRQPWRFRADAEGVVVSVDGRDATHVPKRLDCGIAMLHFELGARHAGCEGAWELLDGADVARWRPSRPPAGFMQ